MSEALEGDIVDKVIRFGLDGEAVTEVEGRQITLMIPDTGEVVETFFTQPTRGLLALPGKAGR